jgi:hypothetical protein
MTTIRLSHKENEKCQWKNCQNNVKMKFKKKVSSNEKCIHEVHQNFLNIFNI